MKEPSTCRREPHQASGGYVTHRVVRRSIFKKPTQAVSRAVLLFSPLGDAAFNDVVIPVVLVYVYLLIHENIMSVNK